MIDFTRERPLSLPAAARLLGLDRKTVRSMIDRGELDGAYFGKRLMTTREAIVRATKAPVKGPKVYTPAAVSRADGQAVERLRRRGLAV